MYPFPVSPSVGARVVCLLLDNGGISALFVPRRSGVAAGEHRSVFADCSGWKLAGRSRYQL